MVALLATMFLGISWLADRVGALPNDATHETVLSQVARTVFGVGPVYTLIQVATALILVLAANTAFADFPRLASLLGRDGYLPRQLTHRGDRLVFPMGFWSWPVLRPCWSSSFKRMKLPCCHCMRSVYFYRSLCRRVAWCAIICACAKPIGGAAC